jgi:translation initiation factor IF-2
MPKIPVQQLAQMMGIANQDLVFKLKSIGVRVENDEAVIDQDVIQAIIGGKKITGPREVILRDEPAPEPQRRGAAPARRAPANLLRPARPRQVIQRVEPPIKTIPVGERPAPAPAAEAPVVTEASATAPPPPVAERPAPEVVAAHPAAPAPPPARPSPPPSTSRYTAPATPASRPPQTPRPGERPGYGGRPPGGPPRPYSPGARPGGPPGSRPGGPPGSRPGGPPGSRPGGPPGSRPGGPGAGRPGSGAAPSRPFRPSSPPAKTAAEIERERERKKKGVKKQVGAAAETDNTDLRAYVGSVSEIEAAEQAGDAEASARRKRRVEQRTAQEDGKVLAFRNAAPSGPITLSEGMTVREFADKLGVRVRDLIKLLFDRGILANINHVLEPELAQKLAEEMGVETMLVTFEEEVQLKREAGVPRATSEGRVPRAPVVTIMGHVDHGKTSLLDAIRSSKVTESEFGGITQHIGAYQVEANNRKIVFLDTPGHEAFTMMRARGARVTDIVVLVVAADDGVMPQTVEAIDHAKAAGVPILVAINKIDKPNANQDRVKKELSDRGLLVEDWGGQTVAVPMSAVKREGIKEMLEMILLTADLLDLKSNPELPAQGTILEARKEVGRGVVATVLVQDGSLKVGDIFVSGATWGRVRAMADDLGRRVDAVGPATPVEVTGFSEVPSAGDPFQVVEEESQAREIVEFRRQEARKRDLAPTQGALSLEQLFSQIKQGEVKELPVVLKADVQGSAEVLRDTLAKLSTDKVKVNIIHSAVGAISTNDVLLAAASKAIILGFNVRPERNAAELAEKEGVDIRLHTVIYEMADELRKAMVGLLEPTFKEVFRGRAEVREIFKVPKVGVIAGCHVVEGVVPRTAAVRLVRDGRVVYEGRISSLRRFKDDASEVRSGFDCGIGLDRYQDFKPGDFIEAFVKEEVAAVL